MTECECLDFFVDEACGAFLAQDGQDYVIGVACLFTGGMSDMTIDVLSRCCWRKHSDVVGPGVLNFQVWEICLCGVCVG